MRWSDILNEMPMSSFNLRGNWNDDSPDKDVDLDPDNRPKNSFVSRADRRLVRNPRIQDRVGKLLLNFPTPMDIYLWNSPAAYWFYDNLDYGRLDADAIRHLPNDIRAAIKNQNSNNILVVLAHNEGGSKKEPLTPWMILHRVAHAIDNSAVFAIQQVSKLKNALPGLYGCREKQAFVIEFLNRICTFKAARENNVLADAPNFNEGFTEMLVQFMVRGHVPFNSLPEIIRVGDETYTLNPDNHYNAESIYRRFVNAVNQHYEEIVIRAEGSAFIC